MQFSRTTTLQTIEKWHRRFRILQGGARSGKTTAILIYLIAFAQTHERKRIDVVSSTLPDLKNGALKDFREIVLAQGLMPFFDEMKTENYFTYRPTGSEVHFMGMDDLRKAVGPSRDVLFINELNFLKKDVFLQMVMRTEDFVFVDYNPTRKFWIEDFRHERADECDFGIFNYEKNEAIPPSIKHELDKIQKGTNYYNIYILGQWGSTEGVIYHWTPFTDLPAGAVRVGYGLDFGFATSKTAMLEVWQHDSDFYLVEKLYKLDMVAADYVPMFETLGIDKTTRIHADGARPEIIREIQMAGYSIDGAKPASVANSILQMQGCNIFYKGKNIEAEVNSYSWAKKANGESRGEPEKVADHLMDAARYAVIPLIEDNLRRAAIEKQWAGFADDNGDDFSENVIR